MASYVRMPGLSADAEEAVLGEWLIGAGDCLNKGDAIATVETDKANVDIESDQQAKVFCLLVEAGATVPVGDPIAILLADGDGDSAGKRLLDDLNGSSRSDLPGPAQSSPPKAGGVEQPLGPAHGSSEPSIPEETVPSAESVRVFASPLARRLALALGIDVAEVRGTGPRRRVRRTDVEQAAAERNAHPLAVVAAVTAGDESASLAAPIAPAARRVSPPPTPRGGFLDIPHTRLRTAIASRLQASKQIAPHFYLNQTLRVDALVALRSQINESSKVRVSINDLVVMAAAKALRSVPDMNVVWTDEALRQFESVDIAVAIASERGLVTPVIVGADSLPLASLSESIKDKAKRANEGRLAQVELEGGVMTVTNLGMFGVESFAAIINPPQSAILAVGAATKSVVVGPDDAPVVATVIHVTLSVDHRAVDGALAARWLAGFKELIESPLSILI